MTFRPRASDAILAIAFAVSACAAGSRQAQPAAGSTFLIDAVARGPLRRELTKPLSEQRDDMVARIRANV